MTAKPTDLEPELSETKEGLLLIAKALEFSTEAIGMSYLQGHHFYHNQAFTDMFGYTAKELAAAGESAVVYTDRDIHQSVFNAIRNGQQWVGETEMVSKSGRRFPVFLRAHAVKDQQGKIIGLIGFHLDITERKKAKNALKIQKVHFRQLFENSLDAIAMVNEKGKILGVNRAFEALFQFSLEEVHGKRLDDFIVPSHLLEDAIDLTSRSLKGETERIETARKCKDNRLVQVEAIGFPVLFYGSVVGAYVIYRDISNRKKAEAALQKAHHELELRVENRTAELTQINAALQSSEERHRNLVETIEELIWEIDVTGRYTYISSQSRDLYGFEPEEVIGRGIFAFMPPEERDRVAELFDQIVIAQNPFFSLESVVIHKNGHPVFLENRGYPFFSPDRTLLGYRGISINITARKQAEKQIHTLTQELIEAQENERQRISRELHDRIAQDLSSSKIACDLLLNNDQVAVTEIMPKISEISKILNTTILSVRDLAYDLRSPGLEELGLTNTIFLFSEEFSEKSGVAIDFHYAGIDSLSLRFDAEINIFRLIQEGLNNIWKHAEASHAVVRLVGASPNIILRIEDDGIGFDVKKRRDTAIDEKRMGLRSMEERVHLLRGEMTIRSKPEEGTIILVKFPYAENESESE